jgi:hypothetical protein
MTNNPLSHVTLWWLLNIGCAVNLFEYSLKNLAFTCVDQLIFTCGAHQGRKVYRHGTSEHENIGSYMPTVLSKVQIKILHGQTREEVVSQKPRDVTAKVCIIH